MWWDGKLSLCDQHDRQVFMTLDCKIPTTRGFHIVTDERTLSSFSHKWPKNVKILRCYVGHTTILHRPLPSAALLRKLTSMTKANL